MDLTSTKKRKPSDDNGVVAAAAAIHASLTPSDAQKLISFLTPDQLVSAVVSSLLSSPSLLSAVRSFADKDTSQRKLFIRGLSWETTSDSLRSLFSSFGDLEEAVIIADKATGKSKGYGFITFKHIDGAILALKEPSKQIDGRITITQLASAGNTGTGGVVAPVASVVDVALRKIYVGNVPADMASERLLSLFSTFGEVEEGPLGLDKNTGKFRGYALFVYKTVEAARAAIQEPDKVVDGHRVSCKIANTSEGKKMMKGGNVGFEGKTMGVDGFGMQQSSFTGGSQFGGPGSGLSSYGGGMEGSGGGGFGGHHHLNSPLGSSLGSLIGTGLGGVNQSGLGGSVVGRYGGSGFGGGPYGSSSQFGEGPGSGGFGGLGMGMGSSLYNRLPPSSGGIGSGGYSESGSYMLSSIGHSGPHYPSAGSPPGPRVPPGGGMYQGLPPYY